MRINENILSFNSSDLFKEIEQDISSLMKGYECSVKLQFDPLNVDSIISSTTVNLIEDHLEKMPSKMKGTGIQRALLINLLKYWSEKEKNKEEKNTNPPTLLLFEEPEVFQHPQKQMMLFQELKEISSGDNQVFLTTHSTHFVSEDDEDLSFIVRAIKRGGETFLKQVSGNTIQVAQNSNRFKFWKYLNGESNKIFFSKKVILCEGNTEKMLSNYLIKNKIAPKDFIKQSLVSCIDCGGKFHIPHFTRICNDLGIQYFLFYDLDISKISGNKNHDLAVVNAEIEEFSKSEFLLGKFISDEDVEQFLFGKKTESKNKMNIIEAVEDGDSSAKEKLSQISEAIKKGCFE